MNTVASITPVIPQSLDALWAEAEKIGRVNVDTRWTGGGAYEVTIRFERRSGTVVHAKGTNTNIVFAVADAISEAREMGG